MTAIVLRGDARALPLPDESVDLIMTSPPYFSLRSYTDGGEHYAGQVGSEATPAGFLAALWECTAEWVRVLKPEGSMFINLGDKYAAGHGGSSTEGKGVNLTVRRDRPAGAGSDRGHGRSKKTEAGRSVIIPGTVPKSLLGLPWRYALGAIDHLGLILRAEIIWAKPNGLPESVTDRVRRSHEQVFHFTRQPRYYAAVDEVREPHSANTHARRLDGLPSIAHAASGRMQTSLNGDAAHPLGKLPGSVWSIPSQPLTVPPHLGVDHFAAYPSELPRRIIAGWSPPGVCTACGQGRRPVTSKTREVMRPSEAKYLGVHDPTFDGANRRHVAYIDTQSTITGYACACTERPGASGSSDSQSPGAPTRPAAWPKDDQLNHPPGLTSLPPTRPAIVLDPFSGTGTTMLVASVLGRIGIGVDLSHDYARLAKWRTQDPGERCRVIGAPKPPPVADGQDALFAL